MLALSAAPVAIVLALVVFLFCWNADAQERWQARSTVLSKNGIVAAEHPAAAQIGVSILQAGGNAVDAAIATNAAMGVVGPMLNGIGGDLFAIVYDAKTKKLYGLNASGWAPAGLTIEKLKELGQQKMPQGGIHSVTVPGCVSGWDELLTRFGKLKFVEVLAPAIKLAEDGSPVPEIIAGYWQGSIPLLKRDENSVRVFLPDGRAPKMGEIFRNQAIASTLKRIAANGRDGFYKGETASALVEYSKRLEGTLMHADLSEFRAEWVEPISIDYRGWTVYEIPPNGQGIAALQMLNMMENYDFRQFGPSSADALHVMIESKKFAYADLMRYVADQKFNKVPVEKMLSKDYAKNRAKSIDMQHAADERPPGELHNGNETTYLCVVDKDGNMVSLIQSNYMGFGTGLSAPGLGFTLQNRGALFSFEQSHPNALAGRKRPFHTIIPAFMSKGNVRIAFGIMGGFNQAQAHAQFVSNIVDHHLNLQSAMEAPRFTKSTFEGLDVQIESRVPVSVREILQARGHQLDVRSEYSGVMGGGQAVMRDDATGVNYGASDPRKDGAAILQP